MQIPLCAEPPAAEPPAADPPDADPPDADPPAPAALDGTGVTAVRPESTFPHPPEPSTNAPASVRAHRCVARVLVGKEEKRGTIDARCTDMTQ